MIIQLQRRDTIILKENASVQTESPEERHAAGSVDQAKEIRGLKNKAEMMAGEVRQLEQTCAEGQREISRLKDQMETMTQAMRNINQVWGVLMGMRRQVVQESVQFDTALWELEHPVKKVHFLDIAQHISKECQICHHDYAHMQKIVMLPCRHSMHTGCFEEF